MSQISQIGPTLEKPQGSSLRCPCSSHTTFFWPSVKTPLQVSVQWVVFSQPSVTQWLVFSQPSVMQWLVFSQPSVMQWFLFFQPSLSVAIHNAVAAPPVRSPLFSHASLSMTMHAPLPRGSGGRCSGRCSGKTSSKGSHIK